MTAQLTSLAPGMLIPFGGDRVATVSAELAAAFTPGDRLIVVQDTGALLHVPAAVHATAAAVEKIMGLKSAQIEAALGYTSGPTLIHADDMAVG